MNIFRTIFHILIVISMVSIGIMCASQEWQAKLKFKKTINHEFWQQGMDIVIGDYPLTALANVIVESSGQYTTLQKAAISTVAVCADCAIENTGSKMCIRPIDAVQYFVVYAAIEEGKKKINEVCEISKRAEKMCNFLPESYYIQDAAKVMVNALGKTITNQHVIISVVSSYLF